MTLKRLPLAVMCLLAMFTQLATAQRLVTLTETAEFTDYRLENPGLVTSPHYEMLIPYARGTESFRLMNVSYRMVTFLSDTTDQFTSVAGSMELSTPLLETFNHGVYQKQEHAALRINITRQAPGRENTFQVAEHVAFRVYKAIPAKATSVTMADQTPLSNGTWYKIPITRSGIFRLNQAYLNTLEGFSTQSIDPRRIQIWTGSNTMLPGANHIARPEFVQTPILVQGEDDGRFDASDAVIFYAAGPQTLSFSENTQRFVHETHLYSDTTFVFMTVANENGLRLGTGVSAGTASREITTFTDVLFKEEEINKISPEQRSGAEWLGEMVTAQFGNTLTLLDTVVAGFIPNSTIIVDGLYASRSRGNSRFETILGSRNIGSNAFSGLFDLYNNEESPYGYYEYAFYTIDNATLGDNRMLLTSRYSSNTPNEAFGFLDYVRVYVQRRLTASAGRLNFFGPSDGTAGAVANYFLEGFTAEPIVLDITNAQLPVRYATSASGNRWSVTAPASRERQFAAANDFRTPGPGKRISNQNLRGIASHPDYIIITPDAPEFTAPAQELADFRANHDGLRPLIVRQGDIFNEYSGGVPDVVAIRDFVRHLYLKAGTDPSRLPRYLLFFGNATHDYKNRLGTGNGQINHVFTYQTRESMTRLYSYGSDDYFGLLDDHEGDWRPESFNHLIDIGIGRLPFNTIEEARILVNKLKSYEDPSNFGDWRTLFTFAADDDFPDPTTNKDMHILNADSTAEFINRDVSGVRLRKIYEMNYPVETATGARFRPMANRDFIDSFNEGSLIVNYSGHGAEQTLSDSRIFQSSDIPKLTNRDRLSIFVTATCSFGRYDDHLDQSGAEKTLLWPDGGIVAAFTTSRIVFTSGNANTDNFGLNRRLTGFMTERDVTGQPRRLGDIMLLTKNVTRDSLGSSQNTRKFILLGDPAMRIGLPKGNVEIESIQGQDIANSGSSTVRALDTVTIEGSVREANGQIDASYNGEIDLRVYDGTRIITLPRRDWMNESGSNCYLRNCQYREQSDLLFNGRVSVSGGRYSAQFVVPKDISYTSNYGRIHVYGQSGNKDVVGSYSNIVFNGLNPDVRNDQRGPEMTVYLDSPDFADGTMVGSNPRLFVELNDDTGINTTGTGVGHELVAVLHTTPERTYVLNNHFRTELDNYKSGKVEFPLDGLSQGEYTLTVRAWDVFNNPSEQTISFRVADSEDIVLSNVYNYPNPMHNRTRFQFEHNQPGNQLDIQVRIYTLSGRPVAQIQDYRVFNSTLGSIEWLGFDNDNDRLATGTYLYVLKVTAETARGRRSADVIDKLVIIR